jgi:hypothetical protein
MRQFKLMMMVCVALCLIGSVAATTIPVEIDDVRVDGTYLSPSAATRLSIEKGNEFEVKVTLVGLADAENIQIEAFISGYEYSDFNAISAATHVFKVEQDVRYVKTLNLRLPENVDEDNYKLRIIVSDRYSEELIENFNLRIDSLRHSLKVKDVWFTPANTVYAGEYLIASVRLKNYGDRDEDGIKVLVEVPELGISAVDYIDEVERGDSVSSEELYLKIPRCNVEPGMYDVNVKVTYDDGHETAPVYKTSIYVDSAGPCEVAPSQDEEPSKLIVNLETTTQSVTAGGQGIVYPLTITNTGSKSRTLVLGMPNVEWGSVRFSPGNVIVIGGGESKTSYVYLTANKDAAEGERMFTVALMNAEGSTLNEVTFKAEIEKSASGISSSQIANGLVIALVVLILILVLIGLIIGLKRLRKDDSMDDEEVSGETYY